MCYLPYLSQDTLKHLPSTLSSIYFAFCDAEACWLRQTGKTMDQEDLISSSNVVASFDFSTHFPALTSLRLMGHHDLDPRPSLPEMGDEALSMLPKTLSTFAVATGRAVTLSGLKALPPTITHLELPLCGLDYQESIDCLARLPLECLHFGGWTKCPNPSVVGLPLTLCELGIHIWGPAFPIGISKFTHLHTLLLACELDMHDDIHHLPLQLTRLSVRQITSPRRGDMRALKRLRQLELTVVSSDPTEAEATLSCLPSGLKSLTCLEPEPLTSSQARLLPQGLRVLDWRQINWQVHFALPTSLTELRTNGSHHVYYAKSSVKKLVLTFGETLHPNPADGRFEPITTDSGLLDAILAVKQGRIDVLRWLETQDHEFSPPRKGPLWYAISSQSVEIVRELLQIGVKWSGNIGMGSDPVCTAVQGWRTDLLTFFQTIPHLKEMTKSSEFMTCILLQFNLEVLKWLKSAKMDAILLSHFPDPVSQFISLNATNYTGRRMEDSYPSIITFLVQELGAPLFPSSDRETFALMLAVQYLSLQHCQLIHNLMTQQDPERTATTASWTSQDDGWTLAHFATLHHAGSQDFLLNCTIFEWLESIGVNIHQPNKAGHTPARCARAGGRNPLARWLLARIPD
jgi:hypothetical protein